MSRGVVGRGEDCGWGGHVLLPCWVVEFRVTADNRQKVYECAHDIIGFGGNEILILRYGFLQRYVCDMIYDIPNPPFSIAGK